MAAAAATRKSSQMSSTPLNELKEEIAAPAQDGMENIMQPGEIRAVRNRYQPTIIPQGIRIALVLLD
jgi:hypothetical protein